MDTLDPGRPHRSSREVWHDWLRDPVDRFGVVLSFVVATIAVSALVEVGDSWSSGLLVTVTSGAALVAATRAVGIRSRWRRFTAVVVVLVVAINVGMALLERVGVEGSTQAIPDLMAPSKLMGVIRPVLSNASGILASGLLVLLAVIFILLEAPSLPAKLKAAFAIDEAGEARIRRLLFSINRYMRIKAMTSLATALCAWALLWLLGIDFAPLWAMLAFFLNFVPVVGNIVMMIPPTLLAVVQVGPGTAVVVAAGYLAINTAIGNVIEPRIMGKGLGISTLAVFLALLFWGWLFGAVGMFLAVPLTAAVIIALDASPDTRPIAILLGPEIKKAPPTVNAPVIDAVVEDELPERTDPAAEG